MSAQEHPLGLVLRERFGGILRHGSHLEEGKACALEAATVARGGGWSRYALDAAGNPVEATW